MAFIVASFGYELGNAQQMGPGYFPAMLGGLLCVLGGLLFFLSFNKSDEHPLILPLWRGPVLLLGAILFFGVSIQPLGLVLALFGASVFSALSSHENTIVQSLVLGFVMTAICVAIFIVALGATIPLLGPMLAI